MKTLQPDLNIKARRVHVMNYVYNLFSIQAYCLRWISDNYLLTGGSQQNKAVLVDSNRDWVRII